MAKITPIGIHVAYGLYDEMMGNIYNEQRHTQSTSRIDSNKKYAFNGCLYA